MDSKRQAVLQYAKDLYAQRPEWLVFFREVLGLDGAARRMFPSADEYNEFEGSEQWQQIQAMLADLRRQGSQPAPVQEPTTVITVRLPKSLHETLKAEAHERRISMNKLCIAKLLQNMEDEAAIRMAADRSETGQEAEQPADHSADQQ